jgi:hypothetical protein
LSRNKLEAIDVRAVRDRSRQSAQTTKDFDIRVERLSMNAARK